MRRIRRLFTIALPVILALAACGDDSGEQTAGTSGATPVYIRAAAPAFRFENQAGGMVSRDDLLGKVWVATFFFVRCGGPCPKMTAAMKEIQDATADQPDLRFVSITVTPDHDSVADLAAYAARFGANPARWSFLRGSVADTATLGRGFMVGAPDEPVHHSTKFILVDREGFIRGYYDGLDAADQERLKRDAGRLLAGAPL